MGSGKSINIAAALAGAVSKSDTDPPAGAGVVYLDPLQIAEHERNEADGFVVEDIDELADSIELLGLRQYPEVEQVEGGALPYRLISGHRRRAAWLMLRKRHPEDPKWAKMPCVVQRQRNDLLSELALIQTNTLTRKNDDHALMVALERTKEILVSLKEQGVELPGRMRDAAAEYVKISKTKAANLETINHNLSPEWMELFKAGTINMSVALEIAKCKPEWQQRIFGRDHKYLTADLVKRDIKTLKRLDGFICSVDGRPCSNKDAMWQGMSSYHYMPCEYSTTCCKSCNNRLDCKYVCACCADEVKAAKADKRAARKEELAQEKQEKARQMTVCEALWQRFGQARQAAGVGQEAAFKVLDVYWSEHREEEISRMEKGTYKYNATTRTPYDGVRPDRVSALAQKLGCTVDYLFCRTDSPDRSPEAEAATAEGWQSGQPPAPGYYMVLTGPLHGGGRLYYWAGDHWEHPCVNARVNVNDTAWCPAPEIPEGLSWERMIDEEAEAAQKEG